MGPALILPGSGALPHTVVAPPPAHRFPAAAGLRQRLGLCCAACSLAGLPQPLSHRGSREARSLGPPARMQRILRAACCPPRSRRPLQWSQGERLRTVEEEAPSGPDEQQAAQAAPEQAASAHERPPSQQSMGSDGSGPSDSALSMHAEAALQAGGFAAKVGSLVSAGRAGQCKAGGGVGGFPLVSPVLPSLCAPEAAGPPRAEAGCPHGMHAPASVLPRSAWHAS